MLSITPATKIAELLEQYPELEPVLIGLAPPFQKLRNPVLRRTVARVASIEQASAIAGLSARELVTALRRAVGQPVEAADGADSGRETATVAPCEAIPPDLRQCAAGGPCPSPPGDLAGMTTIDADALLDAGEVPLRAVFAAATGLRPGQRLRVLVSFRPVPLMERLEQHGFHLEVGDSDDGRLALVVSSPEAGTGS